MDEELDALLAREGRARAECEYLVEACNKADPAVRRDWNKVTGFHWSGDYKRRGGEVLNRFHLRDYGEDAIGIARFTTEVTEARAAWLRAQLASLREAAERRTAGYEAATKGIARFLGETRFGEDRYAAAIRSDPQALEEIRAQWREQRNRDKEKRNAARADRLAERAKGREQA